MISVPKLSQREITVNLTRMRNIINEYGYCPNEVILPCGLKAGEFAIQYLYKQYQIRKLNNQCQSNLDRHTTKEILVLEDNNDVIQTKSYQDEYIS